MEAVRYAARVLSSEMTEVVFFHVVNRRPEGAWFWELEKASEPRHDLDVLEEAASRHEKRIKKFMEDATQLFVKRGFPEQGLRTI
ncbi:unnamed protein product, partial [marine sediment metagenome]